MEFQNMRQKMSALGRISLVIVPLLTMLAIIVTAVGSKVEAAQDGGNPRMSIVATTSMLGDAVRAVTGDRADVRVLMGEGVDPHMYRQTQADIAAMAQADIVFWNGLYLEAQLEEFLTGLGRQKTVVALAEAVPSESRIASADYPDRFDPHVWMDPSLWRHVVEAARDAMAEADPGGSDVYAANARSYLAQLEALDGYARERLATVPDDRRVLISAHDAFGYFGRAHDFEVIGIQGLSTESEAGLRQIDRLVTLIVDRSIEAIFVESSVSERNVLALIEGAAARGHAVEIGGELFSDAMGPSGTYTGTYVGMIDSNVTTITRALGGMAPEGGMNGRLAGS
jgi:manganese/zinc/iron transport system substrate-binding protein